MHIPDARKTAFTGISQRPEGKAANHHRIDNWNSFDRVESHNSRLTMARENKTATEKRNYFPLIQERVGKPKDAQGKSVDSAGKKQRQLLDTTGTFKGCAGNVASKRAACVSLPGLSGYKSPQALSYGSFARIAPTSLMDCGLSTGEGRYPGLNAPTGCTLRDYGSRKATNAKARAAETCGNPTSFITVALGFRSPRWN